MCFVIKLTVITRINSRTYFILPRTKVLIADLETTVKRLKLNKNISGAKKINTVSGFTETLGLITIVLKNFDISKNWPFFVIKSKSFQHDILLGLDAIKEFKLCQDENLKISQKLDEKCTLHNQNKINTTTINVKTNSKTSLDYLLDKYKTVFAEHKYDIGTVKNYEATVKLLKNKYVARKPYKCSLQDKEEIDTQIKSLLKAGLIEHSTSPYASPRTLVFKKEEGKKSRLCIDYSELNKIIVPECYPFPIIDDLILLAATARFSRNST